MLSFIITLSQKETDNAIRIFLLFRTKPKSKHQFFKDLDEDLSRSTQKNKILKNP